MPISLALLSVLSSRTVHDSVAIAPADQNALVLWEEHAAAGGQRELHAGEIGNAVTFPPTKLLDTGGEPSELAAAWNGKTWTIAVCSNAWGTNNRDALVVWGEVDTEGAFTKRGERSFGEHGVALACSSMWIDHGHPVIWVATQDDHCVARRFELDTGTIGKPRPLCRVWAAVGEHAFGLDEAGTPAHVDGSGTVTRAAVTAESDVRGTTIVTRQQAMMRTWSAPFTKPAHTLTLGKRAIDVTAPADVIATADGFVLVQRVSAAPQAYFADWFDARGKLLGYATFGSKTTPLHACALGDTGLYCVWADEGIGTLQATILTPL